METTLPYEGPDRTEYRREYDDLAKANLNLSPSEDGGAAQGRTPQPRVWRRSAEARRAMVNT